TSRGDGERDPGTPAQRGRSPRNAFSPALRTPLGRSRPARAHAAGRGHLIARAAARAA
ncbi:putative 3-methyladenine DNA glycosylase, partial [Clarias magur]